MHIKPDGGFFQSAWVVDDIDAVMKAWAAQGVGPFFVFRHAKVTDYVYRGKPATVDFSASLCQCGPIQIELIQQHDDLPSHYRDSFASGQSGFHHMCRFTRDFDADLAIFAGRGNVAACTGLSGDMRFAYIDTRRELGFMTEIIEDKPSIRGLFDMVSEGAVNWDGRDPVREVG